MKFVRLFQACALSLMLGLPAASAAVAAVLFADTAGYFFDSESGILLGRLTEADILAGRSRTFATPGVVLKLFASNQAGLLSDRIVIQPVDITLTTDRPDATGLDQRPDAPQIAGVGEGLILTLTFVDPNVVGNPTGNQRDDVQQQLNRDAQFKGAPYPNPQLTPVEPPVTLVFPARGFDLLEDDLVREYVDIGPIVLTWEPVDGPDDPSRDPASFVVRSFVEESNGVTAIDFGLIVARAAPEPTVVWLLAIGALGLLLTRLCFPAVKWPLNALNGAGFTFPTTRLP